MYSVCSVQITVFPGARGSVDGCAVLQARRSRVRIPIRSFNCFSLPNLSSRRTVVLGLTQPLKGMSTRRYSGDKARPAHKADNLTAICEPIV
jgi:hypothetical protein